MTATLNAAMLKLETALAAETAALESGDLRGAAELGRAKTEALEAFLAARGQVPPEELATAAPRIALPLDRLREAIARNRAALERGIALQSRVVETIARAGRPTTLPGYARPVGHGAAPMALSVRA